MGFYFFFSVGEQIQGLVNAGHSLLPVLPLPVCSELIDWVTWAPQSVLKSEATTKGICNRVRQGLVSLMFLFCIFSRMNDIRDIENLKANLRKQR